MVDTAMVAKVLSKHDEALDADVKELFADGWEADV
jgi:hypothetical protein